MEAIDFHEIFLLVVNLAYVCIVLTVVTLHDLELEKLGIKTTFFTWRFG